MVKRIITALVLIPLSIYAILKGGILFFIITLFISLISLFEFNKMFSKEKDFTGIKSLSFISIIFISIVFMEKKIPEFLIPFVFSVLALRILVENKIEGAIEKLSYSILGFVYITLPLSILILMRNLEFGEKFTITTLVALWSVDSFAFLGGVTFGKTPLAKVFSPKKSVEGLISGFVGSFFVLYLLNNFYLHIFTNLVMICFFAFIMTLFGQCGDLIESCLKRNAGVKDSGTIIPGHGGILDRIDSMLFSLPIAYLFFLMKLNLYN